MMEIDPDMEAAAKMWMLWCSGMVPPMMTVGAPPTFKITLLINPKSLPEAQRLGYHRNHMD